MLIQLLDVTPLANKATDPRTGQELPTASRQSTRDARYQRPGQLTICSAAGGMAPGARSAPPRPYRRCRAVKCPGGAGFQANSSAMTTRCFDGTRSTPCLAGFCAGQSTRRRREWWEEWRVRPGVSALGGQAGDGGLRLIIRQPKAEYCGTCRAACGGGGCPEPTAAEPGGSTALNRISLDCTAQMR